MMDVAAPIIRILLRYVAGFLLAKGWLTNPETLQDPDITLAIYYVGAAVCGALAEVWWKLARRYGWAT
jgi:hypothetical protein